MPDLKDNSSSDKGIEMGRYNKGFTDSVTTVDVGSIHGNNIAPEVGMCYTYFTVTSSSNSIITSVSAV